MVEWVDPVIDTLPDNEDGLPACDGVSWEEVPDRVSEGRLITEGARENEGAVGSKTKSGPTWFEGSLAMKSAMMAACIDLRTSCE
jgi:hypothetical protein